MVSGDMPPLTMSPLTMSPLTMSPLTMSPLARCLLDICWVLARYLGEWSNDTLRDAPRRGVDAGWTPHLSQ